MLHCYEFGAKDRSFDCQFVSTDPSDQGRVEENVVAHL